MQSQRYFDLTSRQQLVSMSVKYSVSSPLASFVAVEETGKERGKGEGVKRGGKEREKGC